MNIKYGFNKLRKEFDIIIERSEKINLYIIMPGNELKN